MGALSIKHVIASKAMSLIVNTIIVSPLACLDCGTMKCGIQYVGKIG